MARPGTASTCDLKLAIESLESLHVFTDDLRNRFDDIEQRAIDMSGTSEYVSVAARRRKRTWRFDEAQTADIVYIARNRHISDRNIHCHYQSFGIFVATEN